jgi:hypothetical protein
MRLVYSVDKAVGAGCPNLRDDVALVQFFVRAVLEGGKEYQLPPGWPLLADGICGPQTISYIKAWQAQESKLDADPWFNGVQDGQVSPMLSRDFTGSKSHARYAIYAFNIIYAWQNGIEKHTNIATDPRCPTGLLTSIFWR